MEYKVIDGVLYQSVDVSGFRDKLNTLVEQVRPYKEGIQQCRKQIEEYEIQITRIVQGSGLDKEIAKALDPEKASFLGM